MNPIDILGGLLGGGGNSSRGSGGSSGRGGGLGGSIIDELLKGATGGGQPRQAPQSSSRGSAQVSNRPIDIDDEARSLEELLGVATGKSTQSARPGNQSTTYRPAPSSPSLQPTRQTGRPSSIPTAQLPPAQPAKPSITTDDEAVVLIRALINGAKADGRIDANEQQTILSQVPDDPATINFLKQEFAQPLDVREFAWSVPLGMEVKVYTMSLAGMQLDVQPEADYLVQLAHGLRLDPDVCRQIHARYGAPDIF